MTRREIIKELKRLGWKLKSDLWYSPHFKRIHQGITLREAASLEMLEAVETLSQPIRKQKPKTPMALLRHLEVEYRCRRLELPPRLHAMIVNMLASEWSDVEFRRGYYLATANILRTNGTETTAEEVLGLYGEINFTGIDSTDASALAPIARTIRKKEKRTNERMA